MLGCRTGREGVGESRQQSKQHPLPDLVLLTHCHSAQAHDTANHDADYHGGGEPAAAAAGGRRSLCVAHKHNVAAGALEHNGGAVAVDCREGSTKAAQGAEGEEHIPPNGDRADTAASSYSSCGAG